METVPRRLDPRQKPPEQLKALFKKYQKATKDDLKTVASIIDFQSPTFAHVGVEPAGAISSRYIQRAFELSSKDATSAQLHGVVKQSDAHAYAVQGLPGLLIVPYLLSQPTQIELLNKLLHRDLIDPNHKTNLHLHYDMSLDDLAKTSDVVPQPKHEKLMQEEAHAALPGRKSLFSADLSTMFQPKDPHIHEELSLRRVLEKKLRWLTIGGQYDWTTKKYPEEPSPLFPSDIAEVLKALFPSVDPQAAILNLYSPGDTLSVHRDVSEECDRGLISLSFGCDAIFVVGNEDGSQTATIRLRSGDALIMSNPSRFAWHGVPKVLGGTCPKWLEDWPMVGDQGSLYKQWKGWMAGKRINLNVRQMNDLGSSGSDPFIPPVS